MAAEQGVKYVVRLEDMNVSSGLKNMEGAAVKTEASIDSLNSTLKNLAGAFGVGFGLHELFSFGKDAVQGAADFEQAMLRIKFSSKDLTDGLQNQKFILGEVAKFKIPIQEATDAYGKFLAMVGSSSLAGPEIRKLHDDLLTVAKIKHVSNAQMDRAVYDLGALISEPRMDAQHLRFLSYALPGIMPYIAKENKLSMGQMADLIKKHKTGDLDNRSIMRAISDMSKDLAPNLPEALTSIQSGLNEVDTAWVKFKNDLVFENKAELIELFTTLKDTVSWLRNHEDTIISVGKAVAYMAKVWLEYKIILGVVNLAQTTYTAFMTGYLAESGKMITATELQATAMRQLAASMETVALAAQHIAGATAAANMGLGMYGIPLANAGVRTGTGSGAGPVVAGASGPGLGGAIMNVAILAIASNVLADWGNAMLQRRADRQGTGDERKYWMAQYDALTPYEKMRVDFGDESIIQPYKSNSAGIMSIADLTNNYGIKPYNKFFDPQFFANGKDKTGKIVPPNDHITGQRVISYYITIKELNGQKIGTQEVNGTKADTKIVAEELRDILISVVNDSQIRAGN